MDITKNDLDWIIDHPKETKNIVYTTYLEPQTRKAYLVAVLALFKHVPDLKCKKKSEYDLFFQYHHSTDTDVKERYREGKATKKQLEAYVEWNEIIKKRDELGQKSYASKEHLLLSMYTYIPPLRQDFFNIKLLPKMPFGAKANKGNFLVLKARAPSILVLNEFKTSSAYKRYVNELPVELNKIIHKSLEQQPRDYLFVDSRGEAYEKEDSYYRFVNRTLQDLFKKPITVSMLRHSFIIDERKRNVSPGEEEDSAKLMLHNMQQKNYYRFNAETSSNSSTSSTKKEK
jgi:hypothetical protein